MQQGKVVIRMGWFMRLDRLSEAGHHRRKALLLVKPMGKKMHADVRQMGRDLDHRSARTPRTAQGSLARAAFAPIQVPPRPQPIEMADAHRHWHLTLGDLFEHHTARTRRVLVEHLPHQGYLNGAKLSPSRNRWTCALNESRLTQGKGHHFILLKISFRMKSAPLPLRGNGHFYPKENQGVQLKTHNRVGSPFQ
jgi:hypothetical protein